MCETNKKEPCFVVSISKIDAEAIFLNGCKGFATKKELPKGKAYCYETKSGGGSGKIIGEIDVVASRKYYPRIKVYSLLDAATPIFHNLVKNIILYDSPKELCEFTMLCENGVEVE